MKMTIWMLFMFTVTLATKQHLRSFLIEADPLDMANDSVDDAYMDCAEKMSELVKKQYLKQERNANANFSKAWRFAEKKAKSEDGLEKEHAVAIWIYTSENPKIYADFNKAVGNGSKSYKNGKFQYHSLHFLLTTAIQRLKAKQKPGMRTYRRTRDSYDNVAIGTTIRFNRFASTSLDYKGTEMFGEKTCFEIYTHCGADITKFSALKREKEVLIPPYEKFKVTSVQMKKRRPDLWCDVVYTLKGDGIQSNLDCALFHKVN
ncbi:ecto-ADP-ribosyltransferase 5-like [Chanos chanos]|uniref:NAD(P)(+)--arginine ADP-ribosyltransferase n=1 Tax=Chanos chanos TaxID=29144 RepID=A0A6J2VS60_CHACN|nr:ecto-ADP-ribosyltransferase 5-like [Chanos chanos]